MDKSNLELFKQAISEGLSEKFDSVVDSCTEKIVCSEKHNSPNKEKYRPVSGTIFFFFS